MMKRKIDSFIREFYQNPKRALMITGARQTGKTFSIREFGKSYENFIEINFIENPKAAAALRSASGVKDFLLRLSVFGNLVPGRTLVFFDEVQVCPEVVSMIKFLVDEGSYHYVLSGSLLGVELKDLRSEPVGYLSVKEMYPLDFEEFARALGISESVLASLEEAWMREEPVDDFIHRKMMEVFRLYLVVGGMPAVVSTYIETNNISEVVATQQAIITLYKRDIAQYDRRHKLKIENVFDLIPPELNAKNKRFVFKDLSEKVRFSSVEDTFLWLTGAGVAIAVHAVEEPVYPLLLSQTTRLLKLFSSDVGLLCAQYAGGVQLSILNEEVSVNFGAVHENFVARELSAHGLKPFYYNSKKYGELDFVIERGGKVLPIEVKSGKYYHRHRALSNIMEDSPYQLEKALVLTNDNLVKEGGIVYAPIYMTMFLRSDAALNGPQIYSLDLGDMVGS